MYNIINFRFKYYEILKLLRKDLCIDFINNRFKRINVIRIKIEKLTLFFLIKKIQDIFILKNNNYNKKCFIFYNLILFNILEKYTMKFITIELKINPNNILIILNNLFSKISRKSYKE